MAKKITTEDVAASSTDDIVDAMFGKDKPRPKKRSKADVDKLVKQRESAFAERAAVNSESAVTERAAVHNAKMKEEMIAQGKKEAASTTEGGTPREQFQKMFDELTPEEN